jgi:SEC-C motif-containing protein
MRLALNKPCPCHSGRKTKSCCGPWLKGEPAPTPETLMRSRYAAYALGITAYIMDTTDPDGPNHEMDAVRWAAGIDAFCEATSFEGLTIHTHREGEAEGHVDFSATLSAQGEDRSFREHSRFRRRGGRWLYWGAQAPQTE